MEDSWRDTHDEWKLACPYDDEEDDDPCDHEEHEVDWEGRARCIYCGESWWLTAEQLVDHYEDEAACMAEYDRMARREQSRFWRSVDWLADCAASLRRRFRRKPAAADIDDELPF